MTEPSLLEALLDQTRAALLSGDLAVLSDLALQTEAAAAASTALPQQAAERLRTKARQNERLLAAALNGVKAARRRVADLSSQGRFSTYDASGRRDIVGMTPAGPMLRA